MSNSGNAFRAGTFGCWLPVFLAVSVLALAGCQSTPPNSLATHNPAKWEKEITAMLASDTTNRPPPRCIVFTGSSSIRLWKTLERDFPGLPVVNRGFGGSQIADLVYYRRLLINQYEPRQVVIFSGGNDLNDGKSPEVVFGDFVALTKAIRRELPRTKIAYISSSPTLARWKQVEKIREMNRLIGGYCRHHEMDFINTYPLLLGPDGTPKPDIFLADRLHLNAKGYAIWREAVGPHLLRN